DTVKNDALLRKRLSSLLFSFFRHGKAVDEAIKQCCNKPPEAGVKDLLRVSVVMAVFQNALAPESVVNIAVTLAKKEFNNFTARFVNAVLRKALSAVDKITSEPLPNRINDRWKKAFPRDVYNSLSALFTQQPESTVRLRSGFTINEDLALEPLNLELPWQFYICRDLSKLLESSDFADGKFYIQDPAPAHVLQILKKHAELLPGKINFIDLCAAPGGKFIMNMELLSSLDKEVISAIAFDRSPRRLELVKKNMLRCKIKGSVKSGDAADSTIYPGRTFELVTCDVPCSNSGVFRRRPDALWHWSTANMLEIADLQKKILDNAARLTAVDGLLLYSTCSLEAEENSLQISKFLETHREFELVEEQLFMPQTFCDGTYATLLRKTD
ncbi:MAG: RsmB/NOP family class I SAM-dependent RNA methyltransferase, partial [Lentisphaeria bacterium]|nr:RsmB/NOP family class I SAM-dependent RNA methyltransferase [Lentisphaeria bacterium]